MSQFYISPEEAAKRPISLKGEEAHHAHRVFRLAVGDTIQLFDGQGGGYDGRITRTTKQALEIEVLNERRARQEPFQISLAQSLLPRNSMEWLIEKATELGVSQIFPLYTERCTVRPKRNSESQKQSRWEKIALAAAKQCGRLQLPRIEEAVDLERLLEKRAEFDTVIVASTASERSLAEVLQALPKTTRVLFVIGPEGGFSEREQEILQVSGTKLVSLGSETLRSETAGIYVLSAGACVLNA